MRNTISGLLLLAFACSLLLTSVALAADCGRCNDKPQCNCETKCSPCKPQVDPCRSVTPKCISTDGLVMPGLTRYPNLSSECRSLPDCCPPGDYVLLRFCPERYTICPEGADYQMLCEEDCAPCQPVCEDCEFSWCGDECAKPSCPGGDDCSRCGKSPGCQKCQP